jgi:hypothetical protein
MVWLEQPGPDPWFWQRLVGQLATGAQPHPEAPCGPLVELSELPWAEEVRNWSNIGLPACGNERAEEVRSSSMSGSKVEQGGNQACGDVEK